MRDNCGQISEGCRVERVIHKGDGCSDTDREKQQRTEMNSA